ncbi:MAG: peptidoglycan-associated lipoprotein Pal [Bauldia sp.]
MIEFAKTLRVARIAVAVVAALTLAACANRGDEDLAAGAAGGGVGAGAIPPASGPGSVQEFQVTVGDRVFFETDSSELTATARATLDRQAQWLLLYPQYTVTIEGHADERGTREYNIALGARRATAVQNYLSSRGVAISRIQTISYGKERPVAVCNDISCWSQNRRAVTAVNGGF